MAFCIQVLNAEQHEQAAMNEYNFDHPDAFDIPLMVETLQRLKEGKSVDVPLYNFSTHSREPNMVCLQSFQWYLRATSRFLISNLSYKPAGVEIIIMV